MDFYQIDKKIIFLNRELDEEIHMNQFIGFVVKAYNTKGESSNDLYMTKTNHPNGGILDSIKSFSRINLTMIVEDHCINVKWAKKSFILLSFFGASKYHYIKSMVTHKEVILKHLSMNYMLVDRLIKPIQKTLL